MTEKPIDRYIQVQGVRTRYWVVGASGPPLILIHGIVRYIEDWLPNLDALAEHHRVYALDLKGYGRTEKPSGDYSVEVLMEFVRAFMAAVKVDQATLIGHSLGGGIAQYLAYRYPQQVERLILIASAGLCRKISLTFRLAAIPYFGEWATRPNRRTLARGLREAVYDPTVITSEMLERSFEISGLPGAQVAFLKTLRAGANWRGLYAHLIDEMTEILPQLKIPTLVIWGKQDRLLPFAYAQKPIHLLPQADLHTFDACGHFPQLECPQRFNQLAVEFLADPEPAAR